MKIIGKFTIKNTTITNLKPLRNNFKNKNNKFSAQGIFKENKVKIYQVFDKKQGKLREFISKHKKLSKYFPKLISYNDQYVVEEWIQGKTLNLATGGGTLLEFATYLEYAKKYEKKLIILFFYEGNDYTDNFEEFNNKTLIKYFNNSNFSQNLINRQNEIDKKIKKKLKYFISKQNDYGFDISGIFSLKYLEIIYHKLKNKFLQNKIREIEVKRLEELFIKFNKVVKKSNSELIVVHIPLSTRFNKKENEELDDKKNELLKILEKNKIKFLDFTNYVKEKKLYEDIYRFDREILENINFYPIKKRHFNRRGYQELIAFILKNKD